MGYPLDLFLREDIEEEFICAICHDVLQNVTMVLSCEHVFCRGCITQWNKSSNTCPIDRKHVRSLRPAPRIFLNLLNALQKRCQFSGCDAVFSLGDNDSHEGKCNFNPDKDRAGSRAAKRSSDESESRSSSSKRIRTTSDPGSEYDSDQSTQDHSAIDEPYSPQFLSPIDSNGSLDLFDSDSSGDEQRTPRSLAGSDVSSNGSWDRMIPPRSPSPASLVSIPSDTSYRFESASEGEREEGDSGSVYVSEHEDSIYPSDDSRHSLASFGSRASSPIVFSDSDKSDAETEDEVEIVGHEDIAHTSDDERSTASVSTPSSPSEETADNGDDETWTGTTEESELVSDSSSDECSSSESSNSSLELRRRGQGRNRMKLTFTSSIKGVIAADSSDSEQATENGTWTGDSSDEDSE